MSAGALARQYDGRPPHALHARQGSGGALHAGRGVLGRTDERCARRHHTRHAVRARGVRARTDDARRAPVVPSALLGMPAAHATVLVVSITVTIVSNCTDTRFIADNHNNNDIGVCNHTIFVASAHGS